MTGSASALAHCFFAGLILALSLSGSGYSQESADHVRQLQLAAIESGTASWAHWGGSAATFGNAISLSTLLIAASRLVRTWGREEAERRAEEALRARQKD
mgnify:CR=1 FL=1